MSETYQGHCLCGTVQLQGHGAPKLEICHCSMCLHWHGSPAIAATFENGVKITAGADKIRAYQSSDWAERAFCSICGTTLYYHLIGSDQIHSSQAGLFELPDGLKIHEEIFVDEQPDYYRFDTDAPRLTSAQMFERFEKYQAEQQNND
ncbi:MAG: GFA family protein [Hyphomonadaceae bacterium]|nr:GFA family protein [Hyphomonadaceae bacterium]